MTYHDPSHHDPQFPQRPQREDFRRLSNAAQGMDLRAEAGVPIPQVVPLDEESFLYFIQNRLGVLSGATGLDLSSPVFHAIYLDALAVGTLAEQARHD